MPATYRPAHTLVADLFAGALGAVDPYAATQRVLRRDERTLTVGSSVVPLPGRVVVVGMGKAATGMARAVEQVLGDTISAGVVVTTDGHRGEILPQRIEILRAAHPLPDERSLAAGERLLDLVRSTRPDDLVIALISGGGSALAESLRPPLTLQDVRDVTGLLLRSGATIGELNTVRRAMSRLKAGGLLAASVAPVQPLILSDVIGNDLGMIAGGSVIPAPPVAERAKAALAVLQRYASSDRVPGAVTELLAEASAEHMASLPVLAREPVFIGDNARAVAAIVDEAERRGLIVGRPAEWQNREGEAASLGRQFVRTCRSVDADINLVVGGGEATVMVRGDGVGGRNTEFALSAALDLAAAGLTDWVIASLATDGQDGPTGTAGAIADGGTVDRSQAAGVDPERALRENDSLRPFAMGGGLVAPGPTGTNVNDLYIGVRIRRDE